MKHNILTSFFVVISLFLLTACTRTPTDSIEKVEPAHIEPIEGTELNRVILTERAAERLAIETTSVEEQSIDGSRRKVVPYSSLIYDLTGTTWVYTQVEPLTYVREMVTVQTIDGDDVILSDGPDVGTEIVTIGVAELYGTDTGVGK